MTWIVYEPSGRIIQTIADEEMARANVGADQLLIEGEACPHDHYIVGRRVVAFPARPGDWAVWDWDGRAWTDPRDAIWYAAQAEAALAALRAERDARIEAVQWRLQRWRDEVALGITPTTDDGLALLAYVQALRDLPELTTDPTAPVWPVLPQEA